MYPYRGGTNNYSEGENSSRPQRTTTGSMNRHKTVGHCVATEIKFNKSWLSESTLSITQIMLLKRSSAIT